jgi:hypothetical protein
MWIRFVVMVADGPRSRGDEVYGWVAMRMSDFTGISHNGR